MFKDYVLASLAYVELGGTMSSHERTTVLARLAADRGCPGFGNLYRAIASDHTSCDLQTTSAVGQLVSDLGATAPASKARA
jgi:hypothetical protein